MGFKNIPNDFKVFIILIFAILFVFGLIFAGYESTASMCMMVSAILMGIMIAKDSTYITDTWFGDKDIHFSRLLNDQKFRYDLAFHIWELIAFAVIVTNVVRYFRGGK